MFSSSDRSKAINAATGSKEIKNPQKVVVVVVVVGGRIAEMSPQCVCVCVSNERGMENNISGIIGLIHYAMAGYR
jgi:hypothetical protein